MSDSFDKAELIKHYSQYPLDFSTVRLIAHDVRNPLNTIMLANDILFDEIQDVQGDPQKYLALIQQASREILALLDAAMTVANEQKNTETQADT